MRRSSLGKVFGSQQSLLRLVSFFGQQLWGEFSRQIIFGNRLMVVNWCCMCQRDGESIDHLLLHCPIARDLWDLVFSLFGVAWVMPRDVLQLLACWPRLSRRGNWAIRCMILDCLVWGLWRERNARTFEGCEKQILI